MASETGTTRTEMTKLMAPPTMRGGMFYLLMVFPRIFGCQITAKQLIRLGERAGTRTQDHLIKSQVLYHLSYALAERSPVLWGAPLGDLGAHSKPENRGQYRALVGILAAFGPEWTVDLVRSH